MLSLQAYNKLPEGGDFPYSIISDPKRDLAIQLGMVDPVEKDKAGLPLTCRAVSHITLLAMYIEGLLLFYDKEFLEVILLGEVTPIIFLHGCRFLLFLLTRNSSCRFFTQLQQAETLSKLYIYCYCICYLFLFQ